MKKFTLCILLLCILLTGCKAKNDASSKEPKPQTANPTSTETAKSDNTPLAELYIDIIKSNDYFMKTKVSENGTQQQFSISVNDDSTAMETISDGVVYNTVIKDDVTYMIDHQNKLVITSSVSVMPSASNMAGDVITADGLHFKKSAKGTLESESLYYDEYVTSDGDTLRFYFRDFALVGIESIKESNSYIYIIEELARGHKEEMHIIPDTYPLLDMASLGG